MCSCYDTKLSTNILISNVIRVKIGRNYISDLVTSNFKQCHATITSHKMEETVWALQNSLLKWMETKTAQFYRVLKKVMSIHLMKILNFNKQHLTFPLGNFIWVCSIFKDVQLAILLIYSFLNFEPLFKPCSSKALGVVTVFKSLTKIFGECLYSNLMLL